LGNASSGMDIARELCGKLAREFSGAEGWAQEAAQNPPGTGVKVYQSVEDANKPPGMDYDPKDPKSPDWARRIEVVPRVERIEAASSFSSTSSEGGSQGIVVLEGGRRLENVDCIVFGTGYL
ncbi:unnamed protein product, partial [marine sediment metagenome]